jgi:hypothetical protein
MATDSTEIPEFSSTEFIVSIPCTLTCVFGAITNAICMAVFHKMKENVTFKYMLAQSACDFVYLSLLSFQSIEYTSDDSIRQSLATQLYVYLIRDVLTSFLGIFYVFVETWICLQRYMILRKKSFLENMSFTRIIVCISVSSIIYYLPKFFRYEIFSTIESDNSTLIYNHRETSFTKSTVGKCLFTFLECFRIALNSILVPLINILILIEIKKILRKKAEQRQRVRFSDRSE